MPGVQSFLSFFASFCIVKIIHHQQKGKDTCIFLYDHFFQDVFHRVKPNTSMHTQNAMVYGVCINKRWLHLYFLLHQFSSGCVPHSQTNVHTQNVEVYGVCINESGFKLPVFGLTLNLRGCISLWLYATYSVMSVHTFYCWSCLSTDIDTCSFMIAVLLWPGHMYSMILMAMLKKTYRSVTVQSIIVLCVISRYVFNVHRL